ncbi:MAG TPA: hypothetical protein VLL31_06095 [Sulfurovum sp.]|nr:hypothetical protein [Sulfurovum sp.]
MKIVNIKNLVVAVAMVSLLSGCAQMSQSAKKGATIGAIGGAGVAALAGGSGAQVVGGAAVGAVAGGLIGESMNK